MSPTLPYICLVVIPAKAGIQSFTRAWTPTFVGVTNANEFVEHSAMSLYSILLLWEKYGDYF